MAKWFTANFLGIENKHRLTGKAAWFLKHLSDGDLLQIGWCPCATILSSLFHALHKGAIPLPCLLSHIWVTAKNRNTSKGEFKVKNIVKTFDFLKCDIPGYWTGARILEENAPRALLRDIPSWIAWRDRFGVDALGGGWRFDSQQRLTIVDVDGDEQPADVAVGGDDAHMEEAIPDIHPEVAQEAQGMRTYQRRRNREERDADVPGVDPLLPYIYPPFAGPYPNPLELNPLPSAAYFDPGYMRQSGSSPYESRMLEMQSMQLQVLNTYGRHLQSGVIFQEYPFAYPPPPP